MSDDIHAGADDILALFALALYAEAVFPTDIVPGWFTYPHACCIDFYGSTCASMPDKDCEGCFYYAVDRRPATVQEILDGKARRVE